METLNHERKKWMEYKEAKAWQRVKVPLDWIKRRLLVETLILWFTISIISSVQKKTPSYLGIIQLLPNCSAWNLLYSSETVKQVLWFYILLFRSIKRNCKILYYAYIQTVPQLKWPQDKTSIPTGPIYWNFETMGLDILADKSPLEDHCLPPLTNVIFLPMIV